VLELRGLTRRFGEATAVDHVSATVADGEMVAVLGRSGAGKSTLLNMINRLIDPSEGEILYHGRDIARLRGAELLAWRRQSAMIFQRFNLVGRLSVLTNVLTGRLNHAPRWPKLLGVFTDHERDIAIDALAALGMDDQALKRADQLSGGQQQRVAIARALVNGPDLLLADEPTGALDSWTGLEIMSLFQGLNRAGVAILMVTHDAEVARFATRTLRFRDGRLVSDTTQVPRDAAQALLELQADAPRERVA